MQKLFAPENVYVSKSGIPNAGRGVFAKRDIKKGEIIEKCPMIEVPKGDVSKLRESVLVTYFFYFGNKKERLALALGFGSLYNHSAKPNAVYKVKPKETVIEFIALKDIKKDSEITFNYSNLGPLWFEV